MLQDPEFICGLKLKADGEAIATLLLLLLMFASFPCDRRQQDAGGMQVIPSTTRKNLKQAQKLRVVRAMTLNAFQHDQCRLPPASQAILLLSTCLQWACWR